MWWFLIIALVSVVVLWQIPVVGPALAVALVLAFAGYVWWAGRRGPRQ